MIDLHSHVLPAIDDGSRNAAQSLEILRAAAADGTTAIAATPHVRDDWPTPPERMEAAVAELRATAAEEGIELLPGGELDLRFAADLDDATLARFGLGGNPKLLLLETPFVGWPLDMQQLVFGFAVRGFRIVLAHPERNSEVQERPELVRPLVEAGVSVQLTATSVTGALGRRPAEASRALLADGCAHLIASDAHAPSVREAGMRGAVEALRDEALGNWLTREVPAALLAGDELPDRPARARRRSFRR
jgi:protein-tyrosine phosphatase